MNDRTSTPKERAAFTPAERPSATSLEDAANSDDSLQGYAAMNAVNENSEIAKEAANEGENTHEEIARLAYRYHQERGGGHGSHDDDWYRAEQELRRRSRLK